MDHIGELSPGPGADTGKKNSRQIFGGCF